MRSIHFRSSAVLAFILVVTIAGPAAALSPTREVQDCLSKSGSAGQSTASADPCAQILPIGPKEDDRTEKMLRNCGPTYGSNPPVLLSFC
jgi:hypothetical protein